MKRFALAAWNCPGVWALLNAAATALAWRNGDYGFMALLSFGTGYLLCDALNKANRS